MGFFDKFKKNNKSVEKEINNKQSTELPVNVQFIQLPNNILQVEFYDSNAKLKEFYDTTRLMIDTNPRSMAGHTVYDCAVSWYGQDDCQTLNNLTQKFDSLRSREYQRILAEINLDLLQSDSSYCNMVMKSLLDKERVEKYIAMGLQETPEQPCGKYIGGIKQTEKGYRKFFAVAVGQSSHNSEQMVSKRQEYRAEIEAQRQAKIAEKKAQIEKLQSEINDMDR